MNPAQAVLGGDWDAFVSILGPSGSGVLCSTYLGAGARDSGGGIDVDSSGAPYVTGFTDSAPFPTTVGALQPANAGGRDAFIAKLDPADCTVAWSTHLGGSADDTGVGIVVDDSDHAYVTGFTASSADFPLADPVQPTFGGGAADTFLAKLSPDGDVLEHSTYLGGTNLDRGSGVDVDDSGAAYVIGHTTSVNFPIVGNPDPFQAVFGGSSDFGDAFVAKIAPSTLTVGIDIKPASFPNSVNVKNKGVIPVAILSTPDFDAGSVEPTSVAFGPNGAGLAHPAGHIEDADGDGLLDLVLHFRTQHTGIACGDTSAALTGQTSGGLAIEGSDSVKTVGCK